jgi:hypothetical protein
LKNAANGFCFHAVIFLYFYGKSKGLFGKTVPGTICANIREERMINYEIWEGKKVGLSSY